ncbi:hypothetical protein RR46_14471 [Papilio xuthus]|uniref:Uncharacterized protein n=1 Tax=Papilio xuthus TaxID=66420 RepID=A0A194PCN3_PAPXU|nr:hypothetical protein RR46_14471 [Papilio xuthus]
MSLSVKHPKQKIQCQPPMADAALNSLTQFSHTLNLKAKSSQERVLHYLNLGPPYPNRLPKAVSAMHTVVFVRLTTLNVDRLYQSVYGGP